MSCSPAIMPSLTKRWIVEGATPSGAAGCLMGQKIAGGLWVFLEAQDFQVPA